MANLDELLVHELDAALAGDLEELDLRLDKKVERHLRDKETWSGTRRVADSRADVERRQVGGGVNGFERATKDRVEDVIDAGTTAKLLGGDFGRGTVNGRDEGGCKPGHLLQNEGATVLLAAEVHVAIAGELLLSLAHQRVQPSLDIGKAVPDVGHEGCVERLCQELGTATSGDVSIRRMMLEKVDLGLQGLLHGLITLDILLRPVDDTDEAQLERIHPAGEDVEGVGAMVHEVELGQDTDGAPAERVDMAGKLEGL